MQSARLSLKSSELGPPSPHPSPAKECCSSPLWVHGGRYTSLRGREGGGPIPTKGQRLYSTLCIQQYDCYTADVLSWEEGRNGGWLIVLSREEGRNDGGRIVLSREEGRTGGWRIVLSREEGRNGGWWIVLSREEGRNGGWRIVLSREEGRNGGWRIVLSREGR